MTAWSRGRAPGGEWYKTLASNSWDSLGFRLGAYAMVWRQFSIGTPSPSHGRKLLIYESLYTYRSLQQLDSKVIIFPPLGSKPPFLAGFLWSHVGRPPRRISFNCFIGGLGGAWGRKASARARSVGFLDAAYMLQPAGPSAYYALHTNHTLSNRVDAGQVCF